MGYIKEEIIKSIPISDTTEIRVSKYKGGKGKLSDEEQKKVDDMIDCSIEDMKIRRDENE